MQLKYSIKPDEKAVKAMGRDMNVSFKDMIMIAENIRGKTIPKAITILEGAIALKSPIAYRRFNKGIGHRQGNQFKCGKYPKKASQYALKLVQNLQANAEFKGYDAEKVKIIHSQALLGICRPRRKPKGRWTTWESEYCHLQLVGKEI
ncbi:MAG: 50S ribosomal protein L22 [Candidatus Altiarchaeota archaeon]